MVEEIMKNIFRIGVALPDNPLKELNSYFIRGGDCDLLIDTGFRRPECEESLAAGLAELQSDPQKRNVLATHLHSDHSGMVDLFVGEGRLIFMSETDVDYHLGLIEGQHRARKYARFLKEGFPKDLLDEVFATNPTWSMATKNKPTNWKRLNDGDMLHVGDYHLKTILVPGHTPGNCMFWMEEQKTMFVGDHVLFDITPNITSWSGVEDSLGDYLDSLHRALEFPVVHALPGHRRTGDYHRRIEELLAHHDRRAQEALGAIHASPNLSAYDIAGCMTWKIRSTDWQSFPVIQKWFAVGECLSHLDYLRKRGFVQRELTDDIWHYYLVDSMPQAETKFTKKQ